MSKKLDEEITTLGNFRHATERLFSGTQMYLQMTHNNEDTGALVEITEVQLVLPKTVKEKPYLVLRAA